MSTHKQIVWSVIAVTAWLSFMASVWLTEFNYVTFWNIIFWGIMLMFVVIIGLERR